MRDVAVVLSCINSSLRLRWRVCTFSCERWRRARCPPADAVVGGMLVSCVSYSSSAVVSLGTKQYYSSVGFGIDGHLGTPSLMESKYVKHCCAVVNGARQLPACSRDFLGPAPLSFFHHSTAAQNSTFRLPDWCSCVCSSLPSPCFIWEWYSIQVVGVHDAGCVVP